MNGGLEMILGSIWIFRIDFVANRSSFQISWLVVLGYYVLFCKNDRE